MASSTHIIADAQAVVSARTDDYDKLAGYAAFRRIKDDFEEPARPSRDDVESVAAIFSAAAGATLSQNGYTVRTYEPVESPLPATRVATVLAGRGGLQNSTDEGRTHRVRFSPGIIRRRTFDAAKLEATQQREIENRLKNLAGGWLGIPFALPDEEKTVGAVVKAWSAKSRVRLLETVGSLDYSDWTQADGTLAMVTLTLPGQWEILVPDGASFKKLIEKFRRRCIRAGVPWRLLWKLEFQGRGAPHWHALMRIPVFAKGRIFTEWLSETWADVVDASREIDGLDAWGNDSSEYLRHLRAGTGVDFSGKDFSDPRRISLYFLGHSTKSQDGKEYQHDVPEPWQAEGKGPGRFWGYCGFEKAVAEIDVTGRQAQILDRQLRKIKRARDWKMNVLREQGNAKRTGAPIPAVHEVNVKTRGRRPVKGEIAVRRGVKVKKHLTPLYVAGNGRTAHRNANKRAWMLATDDANLGRPDAALWSYKPRSAYAPFSRGQGGFVMVNDALKLGLDLARYLSGDVGPRVLGVSEKASRYFEIHPRRSCV